MLMARSTTAALTDRDHGAPAPEWSARWRRPAMRATAPASLPAQSVIAPMPSKSASCGSSHASQHVRLDAQADSNGRPVDEDTVRATHAVHAHRIAGMPLEEDAEIGAGA